MVLRLQRPEKTSRTSSKPPSTDRKAQREKSRPGGAKPGYDGHSRRLSEDFDSAEDHYPDQCPGCEACLSAALIGEVVSEHDKIDLPPIAPLVERHRRRAVIYPSCGLRVVADTPEAAKGTPFGPRLGPRSPGRAIPPSAKASRSGADQESGVISGPRRQRRCSDEPNREGSAGPYR